MSNQLFDWDESEHDRTGGPTCGCRNPGDICAEGMYDPEPDTYGIPLQEQVEQVEDALSKAIDVIEALVAREIELRNDVYQAQVDAQDWQNKYYDKEPDREWEALLADRDMFMEQSRVRGLQFEESCRLRMVLANNITGLQNRVQKLTDENTQLVLDLEQSQILNVEHLNRLSQLELRNERQAKRLGRILATVQGQHDERG